MDERQYQLYLRLTERFQELLRKSDRSYFSWRQESGFSGRGNTAMRLCAFNGGWIRPTGSAA